MKPHLLRRRIFHWIPRHPWTVIAMAMTTVLASVVVASEIQVDYSVEQFFPDWGDERAIFDEYRQVFDGEDAQVAFFLATPSGVDAGAYATLGDVAGTFEAHRLEEVRWVGSALALGAAPEPALLRAAVASARDHPLLLGVLWNDEETVSVVQARLPAAMNNDADRRAVVASLSRDIEGMGIEGRWALSGTPVIRAQVPELLEADQTVLLGGGILLFFVLLFAFFRHPGLAFIALAAVAPAYVTTLALMELTGRSISILTSFIPIVILVVGICDTIHILEHWSRDRASGLGRVDAVASTFQALAVSCFFTSLTTALGFASLSATGIGVVADFGLFTAFAVLATYAYMVTLLAALLALVRRAPARPGTGRSRGPAAAVVRLARRALSAPGGWIIPAFAVAALGSVALGTRLQVETFLVDDLKDDAVIKQDMRWIEESGFGLFQTNLFVRADADALVSPEMVEWMARFEDRLEGEPIVVASYGLPDLRAAVGSPSTLEAHAIPEWMVRPDENAAQVVVTVEDAGSRATLAFLERMDRHLTEDPPPFGRADLTGTVRMAHTFSFHVLRSFGPSIALALLLIWLVMSALFRSARLGLVAMVPNLLPLVVLAGVMVLLGVALKPSTILVFSIAFGIAVDDSIHLMSRFTQLLDRGRPPGRALRGAIRETGPALVMSTFVVSAGFSLLLLSSFELLALLGMLTALTALTALVADLLLFPALIERMGRLGVQYRSRPSVSSI